MSTFDALTITLDWLNRDILKKTIDFNLPLHNDLVILDKMQKLLPTISEFFMFINNSNSNSEFYNELTAKYTRQTSTIYLEFVYWSLLHFDLSFQNQKINLSATFRRIGDEIYKSINSKNNHLTSGDQYKKPNSLDLVNHDHKQDLILSCLIILKTSSQSNY